MVHRVSFRRTPRGLTHGPLWSMGRWGRRARQWFRNSVGRFRNRGTVMKRAGAARGPDETTKWRRDEGARRWDGDKDKGVGEDEIGGLWRRFFGKVFAWLCHGLAMEGPWQGNSRKGEGHGQSCCF